MAWHSEEVQLTPREASPLDGQWVGKGESNFEIQETDLKIYKQTGSNRAVEEQAIAQMLNESVKTRRSQPAAPGILAKVSNLIWGGREQPMDSTNATMADPPPSPKSTQKELRMPPRISTRKRKRPEDIYAGPDSDLEADGSRPTPSPVKRARKNVTLTTPKRGRGHLKKISTFQKPSDNNATESVSPEPEEPQTIQVQEKTITQESERPEDPKAGSEYEASEILLSPSPMEVIPQQSNVVKRSPKSSTNAHKATEVSAVPHSFTDEEEGEAGTEESMSEAHTDMYSTYLSNNQSRVIDLESIELMVAIAKQVGHTKRGGKWKLVKEQGSSLTDSGELYERKLRQLHQAYDGIRATMKDDDGDEIDRAHARIEKIIGDIGSVTQTIVLSLTSSNAITNILSDIYFILFPGLLVALKIGVEIYASEETPDIFALKHIGALILNVIKLGTAAQDQPQKFQPVAPKSKSYQIMKPIRNILPMARDLNHKIMKEIERREEKTRRTKEQTRFKRTARKREREREWLEREKIEKEEARRRREDKKAAEESEEWEAQQRALDTEEDTEHRGEKRRIEKRNALQYKKKCSDPLWGHMLKVEATKPEQAMKKQRGEGSRTRGSYPAEEAELDGEMDGDLPIEDESFEFERVKMFDTNNTRSQTNGNTRFGSGDTNAWLDSERLILIEELRYHGNDPDVWERLEERLDRGPDEIFEQARELKRMLDHYHERGILMDVPEDDWTFQINI
ncbi:hypothetical protein B7494_g2333 [Chlorociboria aeruginascens]|nr:hypothetical protein B7494_g2333 [Chlorociboria aeruginascens]